MSASPQLIFTSISQWRNAEITAVVSRADPYLAITCCQCIIAQLPENNKPDLSKMKLKIPERYKLSDPQLYLDDPDGQKLIEDAWDFWRELTIMTEEAVARYVSHGQSTRAFG